jgi:hypothetical protein
MGGSDDVWETDMKVGELRRLLHPYADHVLIGVQETTTGDIADITGVRFADVEAPDPLYGSKQEATLLINVRIWRREEKAKL